MFTAFSQLPPLLMLAYLLLGMLFVGFLLVFIRYFYIVFFYKNKFYYLGYKAALFGLKNFGKALKESIFNEDKKTDIKEKIEIMKMKMKELVIRQEIDRIENNIILLNETIEQAKGIKQNDLIDLENQTMDSIMNKLRSIVGSTDINGLKSIIEDIAGHIDELKYTVSNLDIASIYTSISKELDVHTNEYVLKRDLIIEEIQQLENKISECDESLKLLENNKTEIENNNIRSAMKENKDGSDLLKSIQGDFKNLGDSIMVIVKLAFAFALLLGDILLTYKLFSDFYAVELSGNKIIFSNFTYSTVVTVLSFFLPILFFFLFELILKSAKRDNIVGKISKILMLLATGLLILAGLFIFIGSRVLTDIGNPTEIMMALFFIPAATVLAYIVHKMTDEYDTKIMYLVSLPLFLGIKCFSYLPYISWKGWQKWVKQNNHKKTLDRQISEVQSKKDTILKEISNKELLISTIRGDRDKKILEEVKNRINIEESISNINKSLIGMEGVNDSMENIAEFIDTIETTFTKTFNKIKANRDTDIIKIEKKIDKLKKNISDIEEGYEYAMKKYFVIN